MEKLVYMLWQGQEDRQQAFCRKLREEVAPQILAMSGVRGLQLNLVDEDVAAGAGLQQQNSGPGFSAMVSVWMDTAIYRQALEQLLKSLAPRVAGFLVTESEPLPNTTQVVAAGERSPGFSQIAMLARPSWLDFESWIKYWHGTHAGIAIEVQSTFRYVQNVVARGLTFGTPPYDAIVEECFPIGALSDPHVFYDCVGEEDKFKKNLQMMMDSCARFIDFEKIDVVVTSEYVMV